MSVTVTGSEELLGYVSENDPQDISCGRNISPTLELVDDDTEYNLNDSDLVILVPEQPMGITMSQLCEDRYWKMENPIVCQMLFGLLWDLNILHILYGFSYNNFNDKGISIGSICNKGTLSYELVDITNGEIVLLRCSKVYKHLPLLLTFSDFSRKISLQYLLRVDTWDNKIPDLLNSPPEEGFTLFDNREEQLSKWFLSRDLWLLGIFILQTFVFHTTEFESLLITCQKEVIKVMNDYGTLFTPVMVQTTNGGNISMFSPVFTKFLAVCTINEYLGNGFLPDEKCLIGSGKQYQTYYHCCKILRKHGSELISLHPVFETILDKLDIHAKSLLSCLLKWDPIQRSGMNDNIISTCIPILLNFPYFVTLRPPHCISNHKEVFPARNKNTIAASKSYHSVDSNNKNNHFRFPALINQQLSLL